MKRLAVILAFCLVLTMSFTAFATNTVDIEGTARELVLVDDFDNVVIGTENGTGTGLDWTGGGSAFAGGVFSQKCGWMGWGDSIGTHSTGIEELEAEKLEYIAFSIKVTTVTSDANPNAVAQLNPQFTNGSDALVRWYSAVEDGVYINNGTATTKIDIEAEAGGGTNRFITLPAGFDGLVIIPVSTLTTADSTAWDKVVKNFGFLSLINSTYEVGAVYGIYEAAATPPPATGDGEDEEDEMNPYADGFSNYLKEVETFDSDAKLTNSTTPANYTVANGKLNIPGSGFSGEGVSGTYLTIDLSDADLGGAYAIGFKFRNTSTTDVGGWFIKVNANGTEAGAGAGAPLYQFDSATKAQKGAATHDAWGYIRTESGFDGCVLIDLADLGITDPTTIDSIVLASDWNNLVAPNNGNYESDAVVILSTQEGSSSPVEETADLSVIAYAVAALTGCGALVVARKRK